MKLKTSDVRDGSNIGDTVWVCSYSQPDDDKKPLRKVPPTKVIVRHREETKQKIYYSGVFFSPFNKNGTVSAKIIRAVDNTGYRSYPGNEIDIFTTEDECIKEWNDQVNMVISRLELKALTVLEEIDSEIDHLKSITTRQ